MTYSLSIGVLEWAAGLAREGDLRQQAQPVLAALAEATGTTAFLGMVHDKQALCIGRVDGLTIQIRSWSIDGCLPLNGGAGPRGLLAVSARGRAQTDSRRQAGSALTRMTPTDPAELRARLEVVRELGWDICVDEIVQGISSIAVPVHAHDDSVIATISIASRPIWSRTGNFGI
jgi:DNA-binding IclR family transcriptional regulator